MKKDLYFLKVVLVITNWSVLFYLYFLMKTRYKGEKCFTHDISVIIIYLYSEN